MFWVLYARYLRYFAWESFVTRMPHSLLTFTCLAQVRKKRGRCVMLLSAVASAFVLCVERF